MKSVRTAFIAYMIFITGYAALQFYTKPDSPVLSLLLPWAASAVFGALGWGLIAFIKSKKTRNLRMKQD